MNHRVNRRELLGAAAAAAAALVAPTASTAEGAELAPSTNVFIRLRGGADAMSLVVPYAERIYYEARPTIAIAEPGKGDGAAIALNERYALHPALSGWYPLFMNKEASAVLGVGLKTYSASHRRAQRALDKAIMDATGDPTPETPSGDLRKQLQQVAASLPANGARTVLVESLGWDTHVAQGKGKTGRLALLVKDLEQAVLEFRRAAGQHWKQVRLAIVTEFGRTLSESPTRGTEDGHASLVFTFGLGQVAPVRGEHRLQTGCVCDQRKSAPSIDLESVLGALVHRSES